MSICIAAKNPHFASKEVVLCCDWKTSTESTSAETGWKFRLLNHQWCALAAGVNPVSDEVVGILKLSLPDSENLDPLESLRLSFRTWRKRLAEAFIYDEHALTFDEFYGKGKVWLDVNIWQRTQTEIGAQYERQKRDVQMILVGLVADSLLLYLLSDGTIQECAEVVVIGTGYAVAEAALYWRMGHDHPHTLEQTIYAVYEAKQLSEMSPFVGATSSIFIVRPKDGCFN